MHYPKPVHRVLYLGAELSEQQKLEKASQFATWQRRKRLGDIEHCSSLEEQNRLRMKGRRAWRGCCFVLEGQEGIWKLRGDGVGVPRRFVRAPGRWCGQPAHFYERNAGLLKRIVEEQRGRTYGA
jgi:hypothetical protein